MIKLSNLTFTKYISTDLSIFVQGHTIGLSKTKYLRALVITLLLCPSPLLYVSISNYKYVCI